MAQKLIKIAKEFNVGLHTIVETLHGRGFPDVEEKPTADITDAMLVVLQQEFQKDLAIKQEADKLARPVLKKEPTSVPSAGPATAVPTTTPTPAATPPTPASTHVVSAVAGRRATERRLHHQPLPHPNRSRRQRHHRRPSRSGATAGSGFQTGRNDGSVASRTTSTPIKVLGRIDLNPPKPATQGGSQKRAPEPPKAEPVVAKQPEKPARSAAAGKQDRAGRSAGDCRPCCAGTSEPAADEPAAPPDSEFYRADAPQLRGLKILGRISLDKPKPESTRAAAITGADAAMASKATTAIAVVAATVRTPAADKAAPTAATVRPEPRWPTTARTGRPMPTVRRKHPVPAPVPATTTPTIRGANAPVKRCSTPINTTNVPATSASAGASVADRRGRGPMGNRPDAPERSVSQKDIEDQIRQTMARMGAGASRKRQKVRRDKRDVRRERAEMAAQERTEGEKKLQVTEFISVSATWRP